MKPKAPSKHDQVLKALERLELAVRMGPVPVAAPQWGPTDDQLEWLAVGIAVGVTLALLVWLEQR